MSRMEQDLIRIRRIADYQFGVNSGDALFPAESEIRYSRNTGRIRHIYLGKLLQATFRPNDGVFTLTIVAAQRLVNLKKDLKYVVIINDDAAEFVSQGKNVFAKHVLEAGEMIRPGDEVIVVNQIGKVLGVGKALLTKNDLKYFRTGVAVKVRRGSDTDS